ncbi:LuxR C-terminal-related transcriptional regulator [Methylobrevis albus]|uniref:AAA family ATPase n=1 Tax=Methylobrevis albus TaxID=2793297 RepID=A0A931I2P7_9HYPH|nr:LuxR C-terminal-related transcriptional regulator [Methylobrevis albus]MBH0238334.1 AAA family ATPase [Methylobrevis albus]
MIPETRSPRSPFFNRRVMPPRIPVDVVDRPRLTGIAGLLTRYRLTLVQAPAGAGKTTLLSQWHAAARAAGCLTAWYSVNDDEKDPLGLADYLALVIAAAAGRGEANGLPAHREEALPQLLDLIEAASADRPLILFVDDYHLADGRDGGATLEALLGADFPQVGIVIASRQRPALALGRYRAHGEMLELTMNELQFSPDETQDFFRAARGVELSADLGRAMQQHTEGWAAGLRLASLVFAREGGEAFMAGAPSGSHRAFADYFLEEVISGLPEHVIGFLTETCILESLGGDLCDAVTGRTDSAEILAEFEKVQLFIVALPGQQRWYRYHHLFQEFLHNRLVSGGRERLEALHLRAAGWFLHAESPVEAVRHAFLARRPNWAAELIERHCVYDYLSHGRFDMYYRWMQQLPREAREARPLLMFLLVWRYINNQRFHQAEQTLVAIEEAYARADGACRAIAAETGLHLPGRLHLMRALIGAYGGNLTAGRRHIDAIGGAELDKLAFGQVDLDSIHSYIAYLEGDLETAERLTWKANGVYDAIACHWGGIHSRCIAAMCYLARGLPGEAEPVLADALAIGGRHFSPQSYMVALPSALLGAIAYERGDLDEAERLWQRALPAPAATDVFGMAERALVPTIGLARLYDATGRGAEAEALLVRVSRMAYEAEDFRLEFELAIERADRAFRQGRHADGQRELDRLGPLLPEAHARFPASIWRIWERHAAVEARSRQLRGDPGAFAPLGEKAAAARREGRAASAVVIEALLRRQGMDPAGASADTAAAAAVGAARTMADIAAPPQDSAAPAPARPRRSASDDLTARETEVLALMRQGCSNAEIGRRLEINLNTVKSHVKKIFEKLGVSNRTQAVLKAIG